MNDNNNNNFQLQKCLTIPRNTLRTVVERVRRLFEEGVTWWLWQKLVTDVILSLNLYFVFKM